MLRNIKSAPGSLNAMELKPGREGTVAMPSNIKSFSHTARERAVCRAIVMEADMPSRLLDTLQRIESEVVLESSLHVDSFHAVECEAQFGFAGMELPPTQGLARLGLPSAPDLYQGGHKSSRSLLTMLQGQDGLHRESDRSLAACLTSPSEAEEAHEASARLTSLLRSQASCQLQTREMVGYVERYNERVGRLRRQRRANFAANMLSAIASHDEPDPPLPLSLSDLPLWWLKSMSCSFVADMLAALGSSDVHDLLSLS
eukprot:gene9494-32477_t